MGSVYGSERAYGSVYGSERAYGSVYGSERAYGEWDHIVHPVTTLSLSLSLMAAADISLLLVLRRAEALAGVRGYSITAAVVRVCSLRGARGVGTGRTRATARGGLGEESLPCSGCKERMLLGPTRGAAGRSQWIRRRTLASSAQRPATRT